MEETAIAKASARLEGGTESAQVGDAENRYALDAQ